VRTVFGPIEEGLLMKALLIGLVLLVAVVIGVGFYQGWFHVSTGGSDGKVNAGVTVDKEKIEADKEKAKEKLRELEEKGKEKVNAATDKGK
jgi:hypothetical protein